MNTSIQNQTGEYYIWTGQIFFKMHFNFLPVVSHQLICFILFIIFLTNILEKYIGCCLFCMDVTKVKWVFLLAILKMAPSTPSLPFFSFSLSSIQYMLDLYLLFWINEIQFCKNMLANYNHTFLYMYKNECAFIRYSAMVWLNSKA